GIDGVKEAAAVAARHEKWDERPVLIVVRDEGSDIDEAAVRAHMSQHLSSWMMPDAVVFVDSLPHTATGKIKKTDLRKTYADFVLKEA
ncbi:MAG: long-chain fatty acid--CoA ligase, partial [Pseudomonadota bacterium]